MIEILLIIMGFGLFFLLGYIFGTPSAEERTKTLLKEDDIKKIIKEYLKDYKIYFIKEDRKRDIL